MINRKILFFTLFALVISACSDIPEPDMCLDPESAGTSNWLQTIIDEIENDTSSHASYQHIMTGTYEGQRIFIVKNCCPFCQYVAPVYDCSGEYLGFLSYQDNGINPGDIKDEQLFWKRSDSACTT